MRGTLRWPGRPQLAGSFHASLTHGGLLPSTTIDLTGDRWGGLGGWVRPAIGMGTARACSAARAIPCGCCVLVALPSSSRNAPPTRPLPHNAPPPPNAPRRSGSMHVSNFIMPVFGNFVRLTTTTTTKAAADSSQAATAGGGGGGAPKKDNSSMKTTTVTRVYGEGGESTYYHQLQRFVEDVQRADEERLHQQQQRQARCGCLAAACVGRWWWCACAVERTMGGACRLPFGM